MRDKIAHVFALTRNERVSMTFTDGSGSSDPAPIRVTVWGENRHEQVDDRVATIYPQGMHSTIADGIVENLGARCSVRTVTLDDPDHGLPEQVLAETDVLTWWGHAAHAEVSDEVVDRVHRQVLSGMGLVVLHSGHWSKIFVKLMGTSCTLRWRSAHDRELVWTVNPTHPIAAGIPQPMIIDEDEMYGEFFDIPAPDELIFLSTFTGGEVIRSGCTFRRGHGKIFYFSPGDQDYPVYHHEGVRRVIANGVRWAVTDRPERMTPTLLRYDTGDFYNGHSYTGPLDQPVESTGPAT
jgi:trehalose utilization protein